MNNQLNKNIINNQFNQLIKLFVISYMKIDLFLLIWYANYYISYVLLVFQN